MAKRIIGNYTTAAQAQQMIDSLLAQGYPPGSIVLVGSGGAVGRLEKTGVQVESGLELDDRDNSMWERFKNFFDADDDHADKRDTLAAYRTDLRNGHILVIVDDSQAPAAAAPSQSAGAREGLQADDQTDETLRLQEERLKVDKEAVQTGEVVLKKKVVEENRTIDVPVMHEELVVERHAVSDRADAADFKDETISIPLWEEQVHVSKEPVVTEEVLVHKRDVEDTKHVSASVRKEKLDMEKAGNVVIEGPDAAGSTGAPPV